MACSSQHRHLQARVLRGQVRGGRSGLRDADTGVRSLSRRRSASATRCGVPRSLQPQAGTGSTRSESSAPSSTCAREIELGESAVQICGSERNLRIRPVVPHDGAHLGDDVREALLEQANERAHRRGEDEAVPQPATLDQRARERDRRLLDELRDAQTVRAVVGARERCSRAPDRPRPARCRAGTARRDRSLIFVVALRSARASVASSRT